MKNLLLPFLSAALLLAACDGGGTPQPAPDTTPPSVTLNATQSGTTVNLSATATDNVGVSKVEFYRGSSLVSTDTLAPFTASDTVSAANNGNMTYTAKAYDAAGNVGQGSKTVAVNVTAPPAPTRTLYQGVWAWGIGDPQTSKMMDSGIVVYDDEDVNEGRTAALGAYANDAAINDEPGARLGLSLLGPLSAAGRLETGFTLTASDSKLYFVGTDDNNQLELYKGSLSFSGGGHLITANNQTGPDILVALIQVSETVPTGAARTALETRGRRLAAQALKSTFNAPRSATAKANPALLRAVQQGLQPQR